MRNNNDLLCLPFSRLMLVAAAAISFTVPLAVNAQSAAPMAPAHSNMNSASASTMSKQGMDMRKSMDNMHEKMSTMKMSGNVDYDFAMMMRMHHEGALQMAQAELDNGKDLTMRRTAKKIIAAQKKEIAEFDRWLAAHPQ
jgi:uncharacterized protein (DUF305 family)